MTEKLREMQIKLDESKKENEEIRARIAELEESNLNRSNVSTPNCKREFKSDEETLELDYLLKTDPVIRANCTTGNSCVKQLSP